MIIIDGVQDGNIGSLNPNQIESIEVLKDAAALSVYGSKGANGVILVTTKNGKTGKPQVSYNGFVSFDEVRKTLPALNAKEYALLMNEAQEENGLNPALVRMRFRWKETVRTGRIRFFGMRFPNHITSVSVERKKAFLIS